MTEPASKPPGDEDDLDLVFWQRWQQGQRVDVEEFLAAFPDLPSQEVLAVLLVDQRLRWQMGERIPVENYLLRFPALRADTEAVVEFAYAEFRLREDRGERPRLGEYQRRFPDHAERLGQQVELHDALQSNNSNSSRNDMTTPRTTPQRSQPGRENGLPVVPGYEVLGELGRGGVGVVYLARQVHLNRTVALKMILAGSFAGAEERQRFLAEAETIAALEHPGIVQVHDFGTANDLLFFSMELCAGGSLAGKLDGTPLPARQAAGLVEQVARAVQAAHQRGIVHRDLKPGNVLLDVGQAIHPGSSVYKPEAPARGTALVPSLALRACEAQDVRLESLTYTPKITDFGLAKRAEAGSGLTQTGTILGTPSYMAPEQAQGKKDVGPAADVYALGAILYECLTGRPPFKAATPYDTIVQVIGDDPVPPRQLNAKVPADLETISLKCLHKEPARRYASAAGLADDLGRFLADEPITARPVGLVERAVKWLRRNPVAAALSAMVLLVLLGGGVGAWYVLQQQSEARGRRQEAGRRATEALQRAQTLFEQGDSTDDAERLRQARAEGDRAAEAAGTDADATVRQQVAAFQQDVEQRLARAASNQQLRDSLLDVSVPQETRAHKADGSGQMTLATRSADEQYADAFQRWGLNVEGVTQAQALERIRQEPAVVVQDVIAALDAWAVLGKRQNRPAAKWRRLLRLAQHLDDNAQRRELRSVLAGQTLRAEVVVALLGARLPWPALGAMARGDDWRKLQAVRSRVDAGKEPVLTVVLLAQACAAVGDGAGAVQILRQALARRPDEVVLLDVLGKLLERQGLARLGETIECYRAIRVRRPLLGVALGQALAKAGRRAEGEAVLRDLVRRQSKNPETHNNLGIALYDQEKWEEAAAAFRQAIALQPDLAVAHANLGNALYEQKKVKEAVGCARQAIALRPDTALAHITLGNGLLTLGKVDEAVAAFRQAIALKPDLAVAHANLGYALYEQKKVKEAVGCARQAIALRPDAALAHITLGNGLLTLGKVDEAVAAYRKAIALKPDLALAHSNLGMALRQQKKLDEAVAAFRQAIALKPDFALAHSNLGMALLDQKKVDEAVAACRQAIALKPDLAEAHSNLGLALRQQKKLDEAVAACRQAIALKPDFALAHSNLGGALLDQKKVDEAVAAFRQAIALKPDFAEAHYNLGNALTAQKKLDEAVAAYRKATTLQPDLAVAHYNLGNALRQQKKVEEAVATFRQAIALKPDFAEAYYNLGNALTAQKKLDEAVAAYRKAIALKPDFTLAHSNLGGALLDQKKVDEAVAAFRQAIALKPDFAEAHYNLGNALTAQKKLDEAVAAYRKATTLQPALAEAHCNLGLALWQAGRFSESLASYRRGHALGSQRPDWRYPSALWVRQAHRFVELDRKLSAVRGGTASPANVAEQIELAVLCQLKQLHATSTRFYAAAFAADAKLAEDLTRAHRYNAACAAALAVAGKGKEVPRPDKEQARLRQQALAWLRADLAWWTRTLQNANAQTKAAIARKTEQWQSDPNLAAVRDRAALDRLPEDERTAWRKLWADVASLRHKVNASR